MLAKLKNLNWLELGLVILVGLASYSLHFYHYFDSFSVDIFFFNDPDDAKVYQWNTWHFAHQISRGANPFYTDYMCSPNGTSLWMHAYTIWFGLLNVVVDNVPLAINLGIAIQLVAAFAGFYYLAKRFVMRPYFAAMAAYVSVFNTYILAKCGVHYNLVLVGVLPFLLLYIFKIFPMAEERIVVVRKHFAGFLLLLVIAFFMDYYVVFYALAFLVVYLMWFGFLSRWFGTWSWLKSLAVFGILGVGHLIVRLLRISGLDEKGAIWGAADIRLLLTPGSNAAHSRNWMLEDIPNSLNDNKIYIGISLLVYFLVALIFFYQDYRRDRHSRFFLFASSIFLIVSLPVIRISGQDLFYNFTGLVHFIPFVNNVRAPDRFILLFFVSAAIFIGRVLFLETNGKKGWNKYVAISFGLILWFFKDHQQLKMQPVNQPEESVLLENYRDGTLLMLPFGIRDGYRQFGELDENQLLQQLRYGFKIPSGYLSRLSDETWQYYLENELYKNLILVQQGEEVEGFNWHFAFNQNDIHSLYIPKYMLAKHVSISTMVSHLPVTKKEDENGVLFSLYK